VSVVANVAINVDSRGATQQLRQFQAQTEKASQAVSNLKLDALQRSINALPGGLGLAANSITSFTSQLKTAGAASKAATADILAFQAAIASRKIQLAGKGGIGGGAIKKEIEGLESSLAELQSSAKGVSPALLVAGAGAVALAAGLVAVAGASLKFSNEIDRNRQQLTLFTKDAETTNAIIKDLKITADATSLGLPGLLGATKTLAAYGVKATNAGTATKLLGDLALGDNEKLQRFAVNLGQISSIGRAYTVDLKQFAMAGIPIFEALGKVMGTSTGEVLRLAEKGKVTYPIVIKAINELTKEGASFYNGAEKGGTDLDRSLAQLEGSFESLQVVIGTAVGPTAITGVTILKDALDGALLVVKYLSNEFKYFSGLISKSDFGHTIINELKSVAKYLQENPDLMMALNPGTKVLGPIGEFLGPLGKIAQNQKKEDKKTSKKAQVQKILNEANAIAEKNAIKELANLRIENNDKIAKINKNRELQLGDARLNYERQIADFRVSALRRIADMERDLEDQRVKANFDLQQSNLKLAASRQFIGQTQDISRAIISGKSPAEIQSLQTTRDNAKTLNDAAATRRQIEFDSTMKKIRLERTLTDFKQGIEREIGEMQKNYARQVAGILQTAGRTLGDLMVEGAKKAKEIMESAKPTGGAGGALEGVFDTGLRTGPSNVIGGSAPYHQDLSFGPTVDLEQKRKLLIQLAKGYDKLGKKIELSNDGVRGDVFPLKGTTAQQNLFIKKGEAAHRARNGGTGRTALDFYTLDKNQDRFGPSVKNTAMYAPIIPGGEKKYQSGGGAGASIRGMKDGQLIFELMHGATNRFLPQSGKMPQLPQAQTQTQTLAQAGAAAIQAPVGSRAMQVNAANNIQPFSPATTKLEQQTRGLQQLDTQNEINAKLEAEQQIRESLAESTKALIGQSKAGLNAAKEKNQVDQRTLDLIVSGTNPALAAQFAQNEQLNAQNMAALDNQKKKVGLSAEDLELLNLQIAAGPQILEGLNQQAIKQKEISDAAAKLAAEKEKITSLVKGIGASIEGGIVGAIDGAITGAKSLQEVLSDVLKDIGKMLISFGVKTLLNSISPTIDGIKVFGGPKAAGGPVSSNSSGEKGPELFVPSSSGTIIPADATAAAMARYQRQGSGSGAGGSSSDAMGAGEATPVLSMSFETTRFMDRDWVDKDQLVAAMAATERRATAAGAKAGAAQVTSRLQQSPSYRRQVGLR
jgi:tape measure domain-containing protein